MKHYLFTADSPYGHKAGEIVSDLRLPRHEVPGWLKIGLTQEVDGSSVQTLPHELEPLTPAVPAALPDSAALPPSASPTTEPR